MSIDQSKYTFVSKPFASIKDDSSVIHIVPTIAEFDKKWESRPITNPFQFSRKWSDMVEDDDEDDTFDDPCDFKYYESFLVGSSTTTKNIIAESDISANSVEDKTTYPTLDIHQDGECLDSTIANYKTEESSDSIEELSALIKEMQNEIEIEYSTIKYTSASSVGCKDISEPDLSLNTKDLQYGYTDNTSACIVIVSINNDLSTFKNTKIKEKTVDKIMKNDCENYLSYVDENFIRKTIPLSSKQIDEILNIIKIPAMDRIDPDRASIPLNKLWFGQIEPQELSELSLSVPFSVKNKNNRYQDTTHETVDEKNTNIDDKETTTLNMKDIKHDNDIEKVNDIKKIDQVQTTNEIKTTVNTTHIKKNNKRKKHKKSIKKHKKCIPKRSTSKECKENLDTQEKKIPISKNTELLPLSRTNSFRLNSLRITNCNETKKSFKDIPNLNTLGSPSRYSLVLNDSIDIFGDITEIPELIENDSSLVFENNQSFDEDVGSSFGNGQVFDNNNLLSMNIPNEAFSKLISVEKKNNFLNEKNLQLKQSVKNV